MLWGACGCHICGLGITRHEVLYEAPSQYLRLSLIVAPNASNSHGPERAVAHADYDPDDEAAKVDNIRNYRAYSLQTYDPETDWDLVPWLGTERREDVLLCMKCAKEIAAFVRD